MSVIWTPGWAEKREREKSREKSRGWLSLKGTPPPEQSANDLTCCTPLTISKKTFPPKRPTRGSNPRLSGHEAPDHRTCWVHSKQKTGFLLTKTTIFMVRLITMGACTFLRGRDTSLLASLDELVADGAQVHEEIVLQGGSVEVGDTDAVVIFVHHGHGEPEHSGQEGRAARRARALSRWACSGNAEARCGGVVVRRWASKGPDVSSSLLMLGNEASGRGRRRRRRRRKVRRKIRRKV